MNPFKNKIIQLQKKQQQTTENKTTTWVRIGGKEVKIWIFKRKLSMSILSNKTYHRFFKSIVAVQASIWKSAQVLQNNRITEYPEWEGTHKDQRAQFSNSWLHTGPPKIQTLCLRELSKCSLNSGCLEPWSLPWGACSIPIIVRWRTFF